MRKLIFPLFLALVVAFSLPALANTQLADLEPAAPGLPQLPMLEALAEMSVDNQNMSFSAGTCAVLRPLPHSSSCNYSACEAVGCGAPFDWDEIDCACYCGYAF